MVTVNGSNIIKNIIFDVDDTLYDVGTGFTAHRNSDSVTSFMVEKLHFPSKAVAQKLRDEYFARYHSTAKGLTVAEQEGRFPPLHPSHTHAGNNSSSSFSNYQNTEPRFRTQDLAEWWTERSDYSLLKGPYVDVANMIRECHLNTIAFSNGPRKYVLRVLKELGLDGEEVLPESRVFAVDDVLPYCKPDRRAFESVLHKVGIDDPSTCIMVEDSMKNIRVAKSLGMTTVLITGLNRMVRQGQPQSSSKDGHESQSFADAAELTKAGDAPDQYDSAVDYCIESVIDLKNVLPHLWQSI
mmetsp:Transcript_7982/g.11391  ORF Transcript_7982/g.11391 Transcript_7982/m.11391 type:complete len:297 (+) Transcript_7982:157-1047(+)|eukprot:CAMPEP_0184856914 /NCGR_PEP_ID=MMETSP0580-20130426/2076_1 /TAXON_ID=1118495 /ORGANISM="Dactyliosolen fragilissimus" /LENGTH=296 /DNA_ID=CAMNT_0027352183 /DNA_START=82 /DNA_END=972 /DNA_ORIENTATION=+